MTREEREDAINFLKGYLDEEVYTEKCINAHTMAIKSLEQEPCEDAISREDVLSILEGCSPWSLEIAEIIIEVESLPFVTPKAESEG